jgi:hypothetical protein
VDTKEKNVGLYFIIESARSSVFELDGIIIDDPESNALVIIEKPPIW